MPRNLPAARSSQDPTSQRAKQPHRRGSRTAVVTLDPGPPQKRPLPLGPAFRARQARELGQRLTPLMRGELRIVITDNKSVMISVQRDLKRRRYTVRLHHLFVDAPERTLRALARYITRDDGSASKELSAFIDSHTDRIRQDGNGVARRQPTIRTDGRVHDLQTLFDELNRRYFGGKVNCKISWGKNVGRGRPRRSIKVGSYIVEQDLIRIHPGLDQEWIPRFYIQWVVYHEMLHSVHPIPTVNGRRRFHTAKFAEDERRFEDYLPATLWEKRNVAALLCI